MDILLTLGVVILLIIFGKRFTRKKTNIFDLQEIRFLELFTISKSGLLDWIPNDFHTLNKSIDIQLTFKKLKENELIEMSPLKVQLESFNKNQLIEFAEQLNLEGISKNKLKNDIILQLISSDRTWLESQLKEEKLYIISEKGSELLQQINKRVKGELDRDLNLTIKGTVYTVTTGLLTAQIYEKTKLLHNSKNSKKVKNEDINEQLNLRDTLNSFTDSIPSFASKMGMGKAVATIQKILPISCFEPSFIMTIDEIKFNHNIHIDELIELGFVKSIKESLSIINSLTNQKIALETVEELYRLHLKREIYSSTGIQFLNLQEILYIVYLIDSTLKQGINSYTDKYLKKIKVHNSR